MTELLTPLTDKFCTTGRKPYRHELADFARTLERRNAELERAIEDEPECPGDMPDELWLAFAGSKESAAELLRATVRATKKSIIERWKAAIARREG